MKRFLAGMLVTSVIATTGVIPSVKAEEPVQNQKDAQWEEISDIINSFSAKARWTSPNYGTVYSDHLPDSALLGNGNTGITSAGNETEKTYLISDGGFWSDNTRTFGFSNGRSPQLVAGGGITIRPVETSPEVEVKHEYNKVYGRPVAASSGQDTASLAVGGVYRYADETKKAKFEGWVSEVGQEQYLTVDMETETRFNRWTVKHNNYTAGNGQELNTSDFSLEYSRDGKSWITADTVTGNTADETDRKLFYTTSARYVRLHITKPSREDASVGRARISQFEVYCDDNYGESLATPEQGATVTVSSEPYGGKDNIINNVWEKLKDGFNDYSGWVSLHKAMPQWAQIDLGSIKTFDEWGIVHAGNELLVQDLYQSGNTNADHHTSFPTGYRRFNPRDFKVSYSTDGNEWSVLENFSGNTLGLNSGRLDSPVTARYIRFDYTVGEQYKSGTTTVDTNQRARIAKVFVFDNQKSNFYKMTMEEYPENPGAGGSQIVPAPTVDFLEQLDIAKAEINTDMMIGQVPLHFNTWLYPNEDIFVIRLTSGGNESQTVDVNVWGKESLPSLTPAANVDMDKTHPMMESLSGVDGDVVWGSRTTNVADDVMKDGTVYKARWMSEIAMAAKVIGGENPSYTNSGNEGKLRLTIPAGETVTIVTGIHCEENQKPDAENGAKGIAVQKAIDKIRAIDTADEVDSLYAEHQKWWQDYYKLSYADFGDVNLNRLYYGSQYLFGCCTREGQTAPGLYGVWTNNDRMKWQGDYHLNYNFQSPYYGSYSSNRLREFSQPMFEIFARNIDKGLASAANPDALKSIEANWYWATREDLHEGIQDAILYPVGLKQYDQPFSNSFLNQTMNALFCSAQILSYYRYTLDEDWLFEKHQTPEGNTYTLYDFLVYNANFYAKWLEKKGTRIDEEYIKDSPSWPTGHALTTKHSKNYTDKYPDYTEDMGDDYCYVLYDGAHEGSFDFNPSVMTGGVKNLMDGLMEIGREHAPSSEKYEMWKDISDHIVGPEVTIFNYNGKEIFGLSEDRGIRPVSAPVNMEFVHPGDQLGFNSDPYLLQVGRNSMDVANWSSVNSTPKASTMAARVQYDTNKLVNNINTYVINKMKPNFYVDDNTHGWEKVGVVEALNNMLVQSDGGIIKVFPVWRSNYNGKFSTVREKGAFLVSSEIKNNVVQYVEVFSEKGSKLNLVIPWDVDKNDTLLYNTETEEIIDYGEIQVTENSGDPYISVPTSEGGNYRLVRVTKETGKAPEMPQNLSVKTISADSIVLDWEVSDQETERVGYIVRYYEEGQETQAREIRTEETSVELEGLKPGTAYVFEALAYYFYKPEMVSEAATVKAATVPDQGIRTLLAVDENAGGQISKLRVGALPKELEQLLPKTVNALIYEATGTVESTEVKVIWDISTVDYSTTRPQVIVGQIDTKDWIANPHGYTVKCQLCLHDLTVELVSAETQKLNTVLDMTSLGSSDWVSVQRGGDSLWNQKSDSDLISAVESFKPGNSFSSSSDFWLLSKFEDGTNPAQKDESTEFAKTTTGSGGAVFIRNQGNGFSFTVESQPYEQTLMVWVGGNRAVGELTAAFDDQEVSVSDTMDTRIDKVSGMLAGAHNTNKGGKVFTLKFKGTKAGEKLHVTYVMKEDLAKGEGQVILKAIALSGEPEEENNAAVEFLGGSLRMDYTDYAQTSLRFGYEIKLPEGAELNTWYWDYSVNGQPELTSRLRGHNMIIHEDGSITSNLVITGIPSKYYDRDLYAQLTITYILNGETVTVTESMVQKRSVAEVANAILEDETATDKERAYAQGIVDVLKTR